MRNKVSVGEYLTFLSMKYEVEPDKLLYALISAWENGNATCGKLSVERRIKTQNAAIFLITKDSKVAAQLKISKNFLEQTDSLKRFRNTALPRRFLKRKASEGPVHIEDLKRGMKHVSLKAKVLEIPKSVLVFTRFGNYASVTNVIIADETGRVKLCLWNQQVDSISIGDTIQIENAYTSAFRGERQLRIGKSGKISVVKTAEPTHVVA